MRSSSSFFLACRRSSSGEPATRVGLRAEEQTTRDHPVGLAGRLGLERAVAVAVVVEQRMLGRHPPIALERARHRDARVVERFEQRHAPVLVDVGAVVGETFAEEATELGRVALGGGARRGDDRPARRRQVAHEVAARARGVRDHHFLDRQAIEDRGQLGAREVGARQVHGGLVAARRAVAEDHQPQLALLAGRGRPSSAAWPRSSPCATHRRCARDRAPDPRRGTPRCPRGSRRRRRSRSGRPTSRETTSSSSPHRPGR